MGPRASLLYPYEDPWRASAFIFAFTQLLLSVLVLVHTILLCVTCLLMKWYGWWLPCHNSVYHPSAPVRFDVRVTKKPLNLKSNASRSSSLISTERFLKRSRSDDWRFVKSKPLVCPKCHGLWTFTEGLSSKNDTGAASQCGETPSPPCLDAGNSFNVRGSHVEAGARSNHACGTKTNGVVDKLVRMNSHSETTNFSEESLNNARGIKTHDGADKAIPSDQQRLIF
eukprot:c24039_g1_i1 orf=2-676(-)